MLRAGSRYIVSLNSKSVLMVHTYQGNMPLLWLSVSDVCAYGLKTVAAQDELVGVIDHWRQSRRELCPGDPQNRSHVLGALSLQRLADYTAVQHYCRRKPAQY